MIRRVHKDVRQDVLHLIAPGLSLGVLVRNGLTETADTDAIQICLPQRREIPCFLLGLVEREFWPHRVGLSLLGEPRMPDVSQSDNVSHPFSRALRRCSSGAQGRDYFLVRPAVV